MKAIKKYPYYYTSYPVMHQAHFWFKDALNTEEIILKNDWAFQSGITQMSLYYDHISVLNEKGEEFVIIEKPNKKVLDIKGIGSGHFLKTRNFSKLPKGNYMSLRLYIANKPNKLIFSNGEEKNTNNLNYLDFEFKNSLEIVEQHDIFIKLWFELAPINFVANLFKPFLNLFKKTDQLVHRLAGVSGK